jgi:hypothetical protein
MRFLCDGDKVAAMAKLHRNGSRPQLSLVVPYWADFVP